MKEWSTNLIKYVSDFYQKWGIYTGLPVDLLFVRRLEWYYVLRYLHPRRTDRICDIACGNGNFTKRMGKYTQQVVGIDVNKKAIQLAAKTSSDSKTTFLLAYAESLPFTQEFFDKIFSICAFEHLNDDNLAFQEAARVLKRGGEAVFTVASLSSRFGFQGKELEFHRRNGDIKRTYLLPQFSSQLDKTGFMVKHAIYIIRTRFTGWMFRRMVMNGYQQRGWSFILLPVIGNLARWIDFCALHRNEGNILIVHCVKK